MKKSPANAGRDQAGRFKPGASGNPAGKTPGTRHKASIAAMSLLEGEAEKLTRKAIEEALSGNMVALRLCLERLVPPAKERPVNIEIPTTINAFDLVKVSAAILSAACDGALDPSQAAALAKVVEIHRSTIEMHEIEARLTKIEDSINEKRN